MTFSTTEKMDTTRSDLKQHLYNGKTIKYNEGEEKKEEKNIPLKMSII